MVEQQNNQQDEPAPDAYLPGTEGDKGMGTASEDQQGVMPPNSGLDKGLDAVEPIIRDGEIAEPPGLPGEAIAVPPVQAMRGAPYFSSAAFQPPGPADELPQSELLKGAGEHVADQALLRVLVTDERVKALWGRIDETYAGINHFIPSLPIARQLLDHLRAARNELLAGSDHYEEAERHLREVEYRIIRYQLVKASNLVSFGLLVYEVIWVGLLVWGLIQLAPWAAGLISQLQAAIASPEDIGVLVNSVLWGGVGGIVGALYALWRHTAELQDFDKQYSMWYLTNPLMGLILGAFTFLVIRAGLFSLTAGGGEITSPYFIYVMAWIVGFQQNVAYDIVRRVLGIFKVADGKAQSGGSSAE